MKDLLDKGIDTLLRAYYIYETADTEKKRRLIGSMFPDKMHFEKSSLLTGRVNKAVRFIYMVDNALVKNINRTNENKSHLSCDVGMTGFEPATFRPQTDALPGCATSRIVRKVNKVRRIQNMQCIFWT